jgi:magnesium-transporting ATPase (P-type)
VYDNIRKFLQFQLCVNLVALSLVFIGSIFGFEEPLNAVQLLWVNLVMDTMGALALGTGGPTPALLQRKPYKRQSSLISWPMRRNILCQSAFQLALLLVLLFRGAQMFGVHEGVTCERYEVKGSDAFMWNPETSKIDPTAGGTIGCEAYKTYCASKGIDCLEEEREMEGEGGVQFTNSLDNLENFENICLECNKNGYVHHSIIFNAFIFCTFFNEYTMLNLFDEWNFIPSVLSNPVFLGVSMFTLGAQIFLIELGGEFLKTSPLNMSQWLITIALGAIGLPIGVLMRYIPVKEDPNSFFDNSRIFKIASSAADAPPPAVAFAAGGGGYSKVETADV